MPIAVDPNTGTEQVISKQEYARMVEQSGRGFRRNPDEDTKLKLWDTIEQGWCFAVPGYVAIPIMLRMLAYRCSDCTWTTKNKESGEFEQHVQSIRQQEHDKAEAKAVESGHGMVYRCTVCSASYMTVGRCQMHIDGIKRQGGRHQNPQLLLVKRYTLEPSVSEGTKVAEVPTASQVQQTQVQRPRRRRHRNRGGSHHVNAS